MLVALSMDKPSNRLLREREQQPYDWNTAGVNVIQYKL